MEASLNSRRRRYRMAGGAALIVLLLLCLPWLLRPKGRASNLAAPEEDVKNYNELQIGAVLGEDGEDLAASLNSSESATATTRPTPTTQATPAVKPVTPPRTPAIKSVTLATPTATEEPPLPQGIFIRLGVFSTRESAQKLAEEVEKDFSRTDLHIQPAQGGKGRYLLLLGPVSKEQAKPLQTALDFRYELKAVVIEKTP